MRTDIAIRSRTKVVCGLCTRERRGGRPRAGERERGRESGSRRYGVAAAEACRECRFSNGGQYFAAVSTTTIQVYKTYTCEPIETLRGHNQKASLLPHRQKAIHLFRIMCE